MVTDSIPRQTELKLAVRGRNEADNLLERLLRDRRLSEQRLSAAGKQDQLRRVTGLSSMDRAIASTRALLRSVEELVRDIRGDAAGAEPTAADGECTIVLTGGPSKIGAGAAS